jgi:hypothetical protein
MMKAWPGLLRLAANGPLLGGAVDPLSVVAAAWRTAAAAKAVEDKSRVKTSLNNQAKSANPDSVCLGENTHLFLAWSACAEGRLPGN